MLKDHPDYPIELTRLEETLEEVKEAYDLYAIRQQQLKEKVNYLLRNFKHNPDEGSQTYIDLMTGTSTIKHYDEKIRGFKNANEKPYFARVDFTPNSTDKVEKSYIGKTGLTRESDNYPLIIDWRAPIANLYYEGRLGDASYLVLGDRVHEETMIKGELLLKRQFTIEKSELEEIFDIDITTTDPLLQKALGANADNRLKDIASTIQSEQNRIIRAEMENPLIVQGVAGSGKTTIALHRIAYLIYTYEKSFDPDSFMIVAPNNLFLNYISEVLPELGVERVRQTTYIELMLEQLGKKVKVINPNLKLTSFINSKSCLDKDEHKILRDTSKFKGSLTFKKVIDKYLNDIEENFTPREDLSLDNHVIMRASTIRRIFLTEYKHYPIYKRLAKLKTKLKKLVKNSVQDMIEKENRKADTAVNLYYTAAAESESDRQKIIKMLEKRDETIRRWEKISNKLVDTYLSQVPQMDLIEYYRNIITDPINLEIYTGGFIPEKLLAFIAKHSAEILDNGEIEFEDLAPLVYLRIRLFGFQGKRQRLSHVVIDEAQDFSLFQFYILKILSSTNSFTILGDLSQGIHSYRAIKNWDEVIKWVFPKSSTNYKTLEQSYRTTIEIMNLANEVIKHYQNEKTIFAKPIIRHGELPFILPNLSPNEIVNYILKEIELKGKEFESIAIICKTMDECKKLHKLFPKNIKPKLVTDDIAEYQSGIIILPSYLAKGLEFDVVFIITLEEEYHNEELDIKLLYIAMTRALHRLYFCTTQNISPLLEDANLNLYQLISPELVKVEIIT
ncbi:MAG: UvrD-helicase domain-containing protein [Halanaerobiales bacterium]|nr:UvrD-helicase domain-containing protein [Halanaerobiales bacterium]